ncbi:PqqD family protein [Candidatus Entotheonella palauensis]|uniref:PqqD family protein n=1 Tax=Candidatus Entotheonella gemina TaxID=1429439 RepID=W4M950_9BACT|nr:PqqD family protein [Candidatus Entotheonella palauensis]ETX06715.1 MAG: hypothetical protein ETSY2_15500 [Candidatus Entotheonella gemina]
MKNETFILQPESRLCRSDRILTQQADDTMILLSIHSGQYYELNEVGHCVWELCDGTKRVDEMIAMVCATYEAPAEVIRADVMTLLQDLIEEKLLFLAEVP